MEPLFTSVHEHDPVRALLATVLATYADPQVFAAYAEDNKVMRSCSGTVWIATSVGLISAWLQPGDDAGLRPSVKASVYPWSAVAGLDVDVEVTYLKEGKPSVQTSVRLQVPRLELSERAAGRGTLRAFTDALLRNVRRE